MARLIRETPLPVPMVPPRARPITPRISIQWRHARRTGRPFVGARYDAPLTYGRLPQR